MNNSENEKIIELLCNLPELEPPQGIADGVMARIRPIRMPWYRKLFNFLMVPQLVVVRPLPVLGTIAAAALVFWLGMETGIHRIENAAVDEGPNFAELAMQKAESSFLVGRGLMAAGLTQEALPLLQHAAQSSPENPEYAYWEGMCHWANGDSVNERASYMRGVAAAPKAVPLLLNIGHSFLEEKAFDAALLHYQKVLTIEPRQRAALYNRGLVYHLQKDQENERAAWRQFLMHYRTGEQAFRAVERLNNLADYSYRAYQLGKRKMIFSQADLLSGNLTRKSDMEVAALAEAISHVRGLVVDIVVFQEGNEEAARNKALLLKSRLLDEIGEFNSKRLRLSWFGQKEVMETVDGSQGPGESLLIFGRYDNLMKMETEI